jgi:GTPase SAR1 family protein
MGCAGSTMKGSAADRKANAEIEKQMQTSQAEMHHHIKLLLLGAGESGKSTIVKQLKVIHLDGFSKEECLGFKSIIFSNVVSAMRHIIEACDGRLGVQIENRDVASRFMLDEYFAGDVTPEIGQDVATLWQDGGIQEGYRRRSEFQLIDSAQYYFDQIDRISSPDYMPTPDDVLHSRAKTTGIIETEFQVGQTKFSLVDVGGQRSERRKWMHCFQNVTAVLFVVALSGYDLKLYEDEQTNRMHEALKLFKDICNTKWFADTSIILFLNKKDLFEEKIKSVPLSVCFKDYEGSQDYDETTSYIEDQFLAQNENPKKLIYVHHTCATDTTTFQVVFGAVQDVILNKLLAGGGGAI